MRQLLVHVPGGQGATVVDIARKHDSEHLAWVEASSGSEPLDLALIHVTNRKLEGLLSDLEPIPDLRVALLPVGAILLQPPAAETASTATEVTALSPIEVYLSGLQSAGSWRGFLAYAVVAGIVVWIGLFTNTIFLLIGAMLLAPFAGPAMNLAIATARGDARLLAQSLLRYLVALSVTIILSGVLSLVLRQEVPTVLMVQTSHISSVAVLLPLAAGAAGALFLVQSQRSSLVSGASVGVLVAASLAPPAGLIGMAGAIGAWQMAMNGLFLLLLQLLGINLVGSIVFRVYGLSARGARYDRGKAWLFPTTLVLALGALAGLLFWQFSAPPTL